MPQKLTTLVLLSLALLTACSKKQATDEPAAAPATVVAAEPEIDPVTGFIMRGDWELVRGNCTACHSAKLITQQHGTAQQWLTMIRWMQEKQNLWQFDAGTENRIIAYLAENYPPEATRRRAAIPPDLMPPNPYRPETTSLN
jgi:cytochrome c5